MDMLFDSHAHYDDERFIQDRNEVLNRIFSEGMSGIVNPSSNIVSAVECIKISEEYPGVYAAVGVHPHYADSMNDETLTVLSDFCTNKKVVAIGEIGLDYYYDTVSRDVQKQWFIRQLDLAAQLALPVIVHNRDSSEDMVNIISKESSKLKGGVFHCYTGSLETAKILLSHNFYISFSGTVTFKNASRIMDVVRYVPEDMLLIETDSPYMAPEPHRGLRNDSSFLKYISMAVAKIRNTTDEHIREITVENAGRLFNIKNR